MDEPRKEEVEPDEVERQDGELLPDREALSVIGDPSGWKLPPVLDADPTSTTG